MTSATTTRTTGAGRPVRRGRPCRPLQWSRVPPEQREADERRRGAGTAAGRRPPAVPVSPADRGTQRPRTPARPTGPRRRSRTGVARPPACRHPIGPLPRRPVTPGAGMPDGSAPRLRPRRPGGRPTGAPAAPPATARTCSAARGRVRRGSIERIPRGRPPVGDAGQPALAGRPERAGATGRLVGGSGAGSTSRRRPRRPGPVDTHALLTTRRPASPQSGRPRPTSRSRSPRHRRTRPPVPPAPGRTSRRHTVGPTSRGSLEGDRPVSGIPATTLPHRQHEDVATRPTEDTAPIEHDPTDEAATHDHSGYAPDGPSSTGPTDVSSADDWSFPVCRRPDPRQLTTACTNPSRHRRFRPHRSPHRPQPRSPHHRPSRHLCPGHLCPHHRSPRHPYPHHPHPRPSRHLCPRHRSRQHPYPHPPRRSPHRPHARSPRPRSPRPGSAPPASPFAATPVSAPPAPAEPTFLAPVSAPPASMPPPDAAPVSEGPTSPAPSRQRPSPRHPLRLPTPRHPSPRHRSSAPPVSAPRIRATRLRATHADVRATRLGRPRPEERLQRGQRAGVRTRRTDPRTPRRRWPARRGRPGRPGAGAGRVPLAASTRRRCARWSTTRTQLRAIRDRLTDKLDVAERQPRPGPAAEPARGGLADPRRPATTALADARARAARTPRRPASCGGSRSRRPGWRTCCSGAASSPRPTGSSPRPTRPSCPTGCGPTMHEHAGRVRATTRAGYIEACNHFEQALDLRKDERPGADRADRAGARRGVPRGSPSDGWGPYPRSRDEILQLRRAAARRRSTSDAGCGGTPTPTASWSSRRGTPRCSRSATAWPGSAGRSARPGS